MRARLRIHGKRDDDAHRSLTDALTAAGIELITSASSSHRPTECSLVFFERVTPQLVDDLRFARHRRQRVLAVALPGGSLRLDDAWALLDAGASDVLAWDRSDDPAGDIAARLARWSRVDDLLRSDIVRSNLVGDSLVWTSVLRQVIEIATFTQTSVLITGESGTGKELVARLVHTLDSRPDKGELIIVDCTTVVPTLSGSEFFGHERGAFTGAVAARDGAFARAHRGTLFLDEVGELPLTMQAELLRVIQEGMFKRVGSDSWRETRFRLICATNRSLDEARVNGAFRTDLYHRIAAWTCELPPLRERAGDILPLASHFLGQMQPDRPTSEFDPAVAQFLARRRFAGNVRELRLLMARIAARHVGGGPITVGDLPESERPGAKPEPSADWSQELGRAIERAMAAGTGLLDIGRAAKELAVSLALAAEDGDTRRAARRLGVSERAIQMRRAEQRSATIEAVD